MHTISAFKRYFMRRLSRATASPSGPDTRARPATAESEASLLRNTSAEFSAALPQADDEFSSRPLLPNISPDSQATAPRQTSGASESSQHKPTIDGRATFTAKPQGGRRPRPAAIHVDPRLGSHIVIEQFDDPENPKPKGYMGTVAGARICASTIEDYCPCGTGGGHYLVCGHVIISNTGDTSCGSNCKTGLHEEQPFNCPKCRSLLNHVLENQLTPAEKAKVEFYISRNASVGIALCVEYVVKHIPAAKGNIAETLLSMVTPGYGRGCETVPDEPREIPTFAELYEEYRRTLKQSACARQVEVEMGPLTTHDKRKIRDIGDDSKRSNKKQKHKLETCPEPMTRSMRGMKRTISEDYQSDSETMVGSDNSPPTKKSTRRQKQKFASHPEPVNLHTRGEKRPLHLSSTSLDTKHLQANKRTVTSRIADVGDATFHPSPSSLGKLERKRKNNTNEIIFSNKRRCNHVRCLRKLREIDPSFVASKVKQRTDTTMSSDDEL